MPLKGNTFNNSMLKELPFNCPVKISKRCGMVMAQGGQDPGLVEKISLIPVCSMGQ